ncbi:hypothetical protein [Kitasatospora azatica]|uniref:hypothetical protein n=1 Tax=Kitasatospora azatica TaxID=58347 RepID=UPI00056A2864|nr:hypothetical protein [Kitasatospora azatica]
MNFQAHRQALAAMAELTESLVAAGLDLGDLSNGWRITNAGTVMAQFRPLHPVEILQLAEALRRAGREA